ncbi:DUF2929 family protein [Capnocytophaga ochracea]|uniref:DUF2929 family protein n=1 Tax=Capnocytophaga ochracea TaxID=1018 RepID=UPI00338D87B0
MRYVVTVFWIFVLSLMAEFVLSSMLYVPFDMIRALVFRGRHVLLHYFNHFLNA